MRNFILQAVSEEDHLTPAQDVLRLPDLEVAIISTAFMTAAGLSLLEDSLSRIAPRTRIFVGIRNGVTTVQSIQKALDIGCETYMIDTGTRQRIFHPKLYYARSSVQANLLLGSANLTMGGLRTNIEASVLQEMDPKVDGAFIDELENKLAAMIVDYPENVIRALDAAQLADLQRAGRLIDEQKKRLPEFVGSSSDRALDNVPTMDLHTAPVRVSRPAAPPVIQTVEVIRERAEQVWESNGLTRRHLNIPTGANTNPTGSMLLGVGGWQGIDQRHYFRDNVFEALVWTADPLPARSHLERAEAKICLIIKGVNYGEHWLQLSHNTRTDTVAYVQRNSMTSLHWGDSRGLVAHEDLLGRVMKLYRETEVPSRFTLEID
ncbi:hypothetical protein [Maritalea sp.]|uniref:hypothetical protein n=1 Tax=Maritalea sp. TaxID=2003361 RepID=UPI003EF97406